MPRLGWCYRNSKRSTVFLCNCFNKLIVFVIEINRVLIGFPYCNVNKAFIAHCGNYLIFESISNTVDTNKIPSDKSMTDFFTEIRSCYSFANSIVLFINSISILECNGFAKDPNRFIRFICTRSGDVFFVPPAEVISPLSRSDIAVSIIIKIQFFDLNLATAVCPHSTIRIKADGLYRFFPFCRDRYILRGHCCGNFSIPTNEDVAIFCRITRFGYLRSVRLRDRINLTSAGRIKSNRVTICIPQSLNGHILSRHCQRDFLIPSGKSVVLLCWIVGCCHRCSVILSNRWNYRTAGRIKGDRILINSPLCLERQILRGHCFGDFFVPTCECISNFAWNIRNRYRLAVFENNRSNFTSAIGVKRNFITIDLPTGSNCQIGCRHSLWDIDIPTVKLTTNFCRILRWGNCCTVILRDRSYFATAICVKGDRVLIYLEYFTILEVFSAHNPRYRIRFIIIRTVYI